MGNEQDQGIAALREQLAHQKEIQQKLETYLNRVLEEFESLEDELTSLKEILYEHRN